MFIHPDIYTSMRFAFSNFFILQKFLRQNISSEAMVSNKTYLPVIVTAVTSANVYPAMNFIKVVTMRCDCSCHSGVS